MRRSGTITSVGLIELAARRNIQRFTIHQVTEGTHRDVRGGCAVIGLVRGTRAADGQHTTVDGGFMAGGVGKNVILSQTTVIAVRQRVVRRGGTIASIALVELAARRNVQRFATHQVFEATDRDVGGGGPVVGLAGGFGTTDGQLTASDAAVRTSRGHRVVVTTVAVFEGIAAVHRQRTVIAGVF